MAEKRFTISIGTGSIHIPIPESIPSSESNLGVFFEIFTRINVYIFVTVRVNNLEFGLKLVQRVLFRLVKIQKNPFNVYRYGVSRQPMCLRLSRILSKSG